jgi:hypothetical protein
MAKLSQQSDEALFNAMYANRSVLEITFNFFDTNSDGVISREEFRRGQFFPKIFICGLSLLNASATVEPSLVTNCLKKI